ncbi:cell division protein ZapE [Mycetocola reblochoni]|uniref:ATPase, AFG1 family n=2 Tax=Mycetocola reblochoni TaxID=331618 RepID=A0A1R4JYD7_9MICO|nr:cell division protein ZapE [Mycetocola reblochoni]RLP67969.1 cell division protein ZapE [Mycetocola reblochoni]SJN37057.1 ATPase, AFG1 family [Mycetocola reblochoni REB411]
MSPQPLVSTVRLTDRTPQLGGDQLTARLAPPPQFASASFDSYIPDPDHPSQEEAREALRAFVGVAPTVKRGLFSRRKAPEAKPGLYLDGGFGVGKTHLLAAAWHAMQARRKYFGTFIQYTALVGALGYRGAVDALRGASLICIDEFELDDPGDTMVMTRLLGELVASGTRVAATSNTPPNALGEGRFAAADFLREIQAMSDSFHTIRIDGVDYRRRSIEGHALSTPDADYPSALRRAAGEGGTASDDDFDALMDHLARVHPSAFADLVSGVSAVGIRGVHPLHDQTQALRLVALIDRIYDAQLPIVATGDPLDTVFGEDMLAGGYRKKYLRCISRMLASTSVASAADAD